MHHQQSNEEARHLRSHGKCVISNRQGRGGKRKRGRPRKTWKKQVEKETQKIGLKKEDALRRDKWRDGVRAIAEGIG